MVMMTSINSEDSENTNYSSLSNVDLLDGNNVNSIQEIEEDFKNVATTMTGLRQADPDIQKSEGGISEDETLEDFKNNLGNINGGITESLPVVATHYFCMKTIYNNMVRQYEQERRPELYECGRI